MPDIDVSETTHRKLDELAGERDVEDVLWKAMYLYELREQPAD